jgi:hypothetical protein
MTMDLLKLRIEHHHMDLSRRMAKLRDEVQAALYKDDVAKASEIAEQMNRESCQMTLDMNNDLTLMIRHSILTHKIARDQGHAVILGVAMSGMPKRATAPAPRSDDELEAEAESARQEHASKE